MLAIIYVITDIGINEQKIPNKNTYNFIHKLNCNHFDGKMNEKKINELYEYLTRKKQNQNKTELELEQKKKKTLFMFVS